MRLRNIKFLRFPKSELIPILHLQRAWLYQSLNTPHPEDGIHCATGRVWRELENGRIERMQQKIKGTKNEGKAEEGLVIERRFTSAGEDPFGKFDWM